MTSTNDGKEVKSYQTSGHKSKTYFIELYKSLESRLSEAETAGERTNHLCEAWRRVHSLCQHSASTTHPHLLSWLQRHTARAVLQTKWQSPERKDDRRNLEDAINVFIVESNVAAASREGDTHQWEAQLVARGEWFKKVLEHPWKHPVLNCLLNPDGTPPTDNEVLEWLKEERGVTFVMRLHTLVAEKCDDIAMSLATAVMERVRGGIIAASDLDQSDDRKDKPEQNASSFGERLKEEAGFTVDVWEMLTDIEFVLLHKRDSSRCITLAKRTPLRGAYQLIERLQSRLETSPRDKRLWKNSKEVAVLIAQVVITRCMMIPACVGGSRSALYCCARSLARLMPRGRLAGAAAALAAPAPTAAHLHTLAAAIDAQLAQKNEASMKPFVCELYVRAITAGMNELERLKLKTEKDMEARSMEQTIGSWFVQLGAVLSSSERVKCECALTAFSVHPSPQMYERIKAAPALQPIPIPEEETSKDANPEFGSWASDSRSQTNFVKTSETLNMKARQNQANVLSTAILTEGEALGLSPELCQDITVLLSGPRVKTLSWDMDRELLLENCRAYLERTHGGTKAVTTELKYLNLNPADFQYLPEEDDDETNIYYGIEKGYEHLVEFQEPEDIWEEAYDKADTAYFEKANTSYSSEEFDFIQPQRRRKTKKPNLKSDEDDPLSLVAETKRKEKKERPLSKERSKEKKKAADTLEKKESGDPLELGNQEQKKDKPKRERKKKAPKPTDGSLANLVGLKVGNSTKSTKILVADSDADSQGHSSVRSINSEENVLYDGVFSMDDMRSPRSSNSSDSIGLMQSNESLMASGHVGNNPKPIFNRPYRTASVSGIRNASPSPSKSHSPSDRSRNDSPISDEVKGSLTKLLEYRRQKALEDQHRKPNAIIRPHGSMAMDKINISPKGVAIPEIPKSYISKQSDNMTMVNQMDHNLNQRKPNTAIPSPVIQYASKQFTSPDKLSQSHYGPSPRQYNNAADRMAPSDRCFSTPPSSDKFLDSVNLISIYDKLEPTGSRNPYDKSSSYPDVSQDNQRRSNVDTSYINYQDYIHEFSLNAYNQYTEHRDASKKVTSPTSIVSPVVQNKNPKYKAPQSTKQITQKKPDGSLNTFARMSYYKNKQTDMKKSHDIAQNLQPQTVGSKLDGFIMDQLLQNSQKPATSEASVQALMMRLKTETPQTTTTTRDHPMLSNILQGNLSQVQHQRTTTSPPKSVLSEKDHNDLLLLLRQQNALNKPQNLHAASCSKRHPTLNSSLAFGSKCINSRTDANYDSNTSLVPASFLPNQQSGKPNEVVKKVAEGKMINVLSTSIIKTADKTPKDPKTKPANTKKPIEDKNKKTKSRGSKKIVPKPEPRKNPEEWENVMNAILKQKTPCRGPNALDMALNKSSFEKAFEESLRKPPCLFRSPSDDLTQSTIISQTESIHEEFVNITQSSATAFSSQTVTKTQKTTYTPLKIPCRASLLKKNSKTKKSVKTPLKVTSTVETLIRQQKIEKNTIERLMQNNNIEITKHTSRITLLEIPERSHKLSNVEKPVKQQRQVDKSKINVQQNHVDRLKKTVNHNNDEPKKHEKQIVSEIPEKESKQGNVQLNQLNNAGLKQDDPFMPGIPNSDYDLLDELMDDDLRKEIGELSSDEETYHAQDFIKDTKLDQTRVEVKYNHAIIDKDSVAPLITTRQPMCKQNQTPQSISQNPTQRQQSNEPVRPAQNKPAMCLNSSNVHNVSTHVTSQSTQARPCNSASVLRSTQIPRERNTFTAVPRPAPVQNVMRTPSELTYENYSPVQSSMQAVPNIATNTYIARTNASNKSVYQPTQFVEPPVSPLTSAAPTTPLIAPVVNNVNIATGQPQSVIKVTQTEYCLSSNELHQPFHFATAPGNNIVDGNKLEAEITSCVHNVAGTDILQKTAEVKTSADENDGKSSERKVLKEVQEKYADEKIDCESNQQATNKSLKATANYPKTQADQDRLEKKRMAILNRNISNFCGIKTIALGYLPLQLPSTQKKDDHVADINDTENDLIPSNENNLQEASNEINSPATPDSCKENKNEPAQVRRILLRSSNKFKSKISCLTTSLKPSLAQKLKNSTAIPSNTLSETPSQNEKSDLEMNDKQKRVSKRIRIKSVTTPQDTINDETKLEFEVQKKTTGTPKVSKRKVKNASSKIKSPTSNNDSEAKKLFDVESKLVGSTIQKIKPICLNRPDPTCLGDKLVETLIIQEDKLLKSLSVNKTTISDDLTELPKISVNVTNETGKINATVDDSTEDVINSVFEETKVQQNETVVTKDKYENINDNVKEITSSVKLSLQSDEVKTDLTPEMISPIEILKIPIPQEKYHTPPTNITNNEIAQKNYNNGDRYDVKQNSAQNISHDKNTVGQRQKTHENVDSNKNHNIVAPQSQLVTGVDDDDDIEIIGDIPNNPPKPKDIQSKLSPDSIVIEHISSAHDIDPLKKRVRIKLGNGKVFRGTVSGSVNVNTLLDDPKIKALLMSQFEQSKSLYSLKLNVNKDFSNGTQIFSAQVKQKPKPHLPMETVSLLSDDEEDDSPKLFETEYGKHKIAPMDAGLFKKHQKKLMVKSYVSMKKLSLAEINAVKHRSGTIHQGYVNMHTQILKECVKLDDIESPPVCSKKLDDSNIFAAIPSKYVQGVFDDIDNILTPTNTDSKEEPIVLIDDSSNDSIDIKNKPETKEKIDELKNMLLKDLGVDNFLTSTNETPDDVQVTWDSEAIDLTDDPVLEITGHTPELIVKEDYKKMKIRECFVKLVRCDDPPKSQPILVKDDEFDEIKDDIIPAPLSRSGSFSILEEFPAVDELNKNTAENEQSRSSPVMEIYDLIASLEKTSTKQNILDWSEVPLKCYTEWMTTKRDENLKSLNVTMKHLVSQTPVVPKLSMLVLSYIQKEDLVNKNNFHTSLISLKRKTMPSSIPVAKMSKLKHSVDETHSYVSTLTLDMSDSRVTKEIDDKIEASIGTKEVLKAEEQKIKVDLNTSNLSDTDETSMTVSDFSDNDDMTLMNIDMVFEDNREANTGKNIHINKIFDLNKDVTLVCHTDNETELENKVSECQNMSIVDSININPDLNKNCVADFYKEQKITKETLAEFPIEPVDDIRIDLDIIKQIEEPELIQTDLHKASVDQNNIVCQTDFGTELDHEVSEMQNRLKMNSIDVHPDLSKNTMADFSKEQSSRKISKETSVELLIDLVNDIPIDLDIVKQTEEPDLIQTDLFKVSLDENNTVRHTDDDGKVLNNKVIKSQNNLIINSVEVNPDIYREIQKETKAKLPIDHIDVIPIDLEMKQIVEPVSIKTDLLQDHKDNDKNIISSGIPQDMHEFHNADNTDVGVVGVTGDQVSGKCQSETLLLKTLEVDEKLDEYSESGVTKCIVEKMKESKGFFIAKEVDKALDVLGTHKNASVYLEIPLQKTTGDPNIEYYTREPLIDQKSSEMCIGVDNQLMDQTIFPKIYSNEKTTLQTTISKNNEHVFKESSSKQYTENNCKTQISNQYEVPEYFNQGIIMQEPKNIENTNMPNEEALCNKNIVRLENEDSDHKLQQSVENSQTTQKNNTISKATHLSITNDEIVDALNQIFGEKSNNSYPDKTDALLTRGHKKASINSQHNYCNDSNQKDLFDENIKSIESLTMSEKVQIENTVIKVEKSNKDHIGHIPKTTDEIVTALKKMFGEPDDSMDMSEVVGTENPENFSSVKIPIIPNLKDLVVKAPIEHHADTINMSLNGLSLIEEPDCDTVVEGIVDMLSDEIIGDITVVNLNCNESDMKNIEKDNIEENIVADDGTFNNEVSDSSNDNLRNILNCYMEPNGQVDTKDPVIGTCYVVSVLKESAEITGNDSEIKECEKNIDNELNKKENDDMKLIIPKHSYSSLKNSDETIRRSSRNIKRKKDMTDMKTVERKYRKGKNIDYPKTTALAIADLAYAKEYKRIIDYCSTIKFSYARPFHIECIDVHNMLKSWPITDCSDVEISDPNNTQELLYRDTEDTENVKVITDPLKQTLNEEIVNGENINSYESIDINETNFNMGFGERSGRVIQKIETGITKLSAATLSDVKQYQPCSMSEVNESCFVRDNDTQKVKLSDFTNLINIKEKIRSFFKKTEVELASELLQNKKYTASDHHLSKFPFCLTGTEYMEFPRMETVVNVVQVGQLPVSATVQNSVTCDPRVTHVSDASPSHCSDNSTGDDTHSTVETEYTELTTANITLPLVQEYAHNHHQSPPSQEQNSPENNDEPHDTSFSIVKIELMEETSQENFETDIYDNDFSPLPNNNIEYSFEDTSNTLFNTSVNLHNTSKTNNTSNNMFNTTTSTMDTAFTNIMFDHTTNSAYSIDNTPSSTESTYTNMDNASSSVYSTSPNMGNSSTEIDDTVNMNEGSSNMDRTTNMDDSSASKTYSSMYNPMGSDSNDVNNTASNINDSSIELENRTTNMNSTSNVENATYNYTYENIEDYAANIENNNNYAADVDNFDAVENYSANVDDYASNVENYAPNDESYRAGVEKYASNIENYAIENYSTNVENYTNNVDNTDTNINDNLTNIHSSTANILEEPQDLSMANSSLESKSCNTFEDGDTSKINQIEHAMDAAGISAESVITSGTDELANLITQSAQATSDNYSKSTPINVMTLQQALAHVLPPPLNQTGTSDNSVTNNPVTQQVLHIVQGNNPQTVINKGNGTHLVHIVQNKNNPVNNGLSLVDAGLQQGGNQLIHIVNNGNQNNAQFLKRVNLLTNLTNAQGSNEQKMIQLVCKSADGKSIQLNTGHQRSMVLRLHPTTVQAAQKPTEPQDLSAASSSAENSANGQDPTQDIKSRSVYEENYAQFIQNSGPTPGSSSTTPCQEKATSLPKFNQVFGKQSYQENQNEINNGLQENTDCSPEENNSHLEQAPEVNDPPLVARIAPTEATKDQHSPAPQIKQTLSPMNIHTTMHGGVIYTRQIPVNIGGRQTINLITVPTTELDEDSTQKQQSDSNFVSQEGEQSSIIKLVPHHTSNNNVPPEEKTTQASTSNETNHNPQPVLTQMRIKLPMLSKGHHIVPGARLVRPSFFQIQRNVIAGTNQPVYQQLVLTTAPPHGQTIRLPTHSPQGPPLLVQTSQHPQSSPHIPVQQVQHAPSSQHVTVQQTHSAPRTPQPHSVPPELTKPDAVPESELSTLTLEQLREFDMVLEQVKERSVQPTPSTTPSANPCTPADSTDGPTLATTSVSESTQQVLYSVENSQPTNVVSYVNRKSTITSATTSFVRSPDSSGIVDSPSSSTQVQITHTVTSKSSTSDGGSSVVSQPKKKKKKKPPPSSSTMASLGSPSKTNPLKPQEDEQTTQRILYILAEYKEQVENSPDKNKPAPRRRNQFPPTVGSKRKRHCSSRATCRREGASPMHGEPGELGDDLITLGSEDSSCGTTFSECMDCQEIHSPDSPTKVVRRLTFEQETTTQITQTQSSQQPQRNVIVGDRQTITVARTTTATTAKPTTTVLMPANYILPVSMLKGGQQIAIMTNRGPKILVGAGDNNTGALLIQRLITPGLKPVLTRPGVRHIRLPTTLHNLQAFNIQTTPVTQVQPPDSTAPQTPMPGPPDLIDMRTMSTPWQDREANDKPTRGPSPDCTEPWNLPSSSIADDYGYEEIVRTDNMERTVLVVQQRKDGRHHRVTHVSTAALRHKYAILEHELRLQKSLSEECEDLGVDSPSASELFPEADILFGAPSPAHEQTIDQCSTPPPIPMPPQPELDDQIAADTPLAPPPRNDDLDLNLDDDVGEIVTVGEDGIATIPIINAEEFARSHPNTTFHTEPEDGEIPPFTIAQSIKGRHITFHANRVPGTVVMAPQTTVISQATINNNDHNTVKFIDIDNMINSMPCPQPVVKSVLVKDTGNSRPQSKFDSLKEPGPSSHKSSSKSDSQKNSGKSRTSSKFDSSKDLGTFAPRTKFDILKEPNTSHRSSSKLDSLKDSGSAAHKSSSKFDGLREPGVSTSRSGSKFDSLKDPGVSNSRSSAKHDKEAGSRSYSKFENLKDTGNLAPKPLSKFDSLLTESKLQLSSNTSARQVVHSTGHGTQVIRRLRYDERTNTRTNSKFHFEHPRRRTSISDEVKMRNDRAMVESMGDNASSPGQPELFWDSTSTERHERRFHFSEGEKVTKSPFDELLNDSSAYGPHTRLDSVIKAARSDSNYERTSFEGTSISGSTDESRPLRTYPPKRAPTQHTQDTERHFTLKTTTTTTHHHEVDRTTMKTTHHHEVDRTKKTRCQESEGRRRTGRGLVKRGCSCCNGSQSAPPKKRSRPKKPPPEFPPSNKTDPLT